MGTVFIGLMKTFGTEIGARTGPNISGPAKLELANKVAPKTPAKEAAVKKRLIFIP